MKRENISAVPIKNNIAVQLVLRNMMTDYVQLQARPLAIELIVVSKFRSNNEMRC